MLKVLLNTHLRLQILQLKLNKPDFKLKQMLKDHRIIPMLPIKLPYLLLKLCNKQTISPIEQSLSTSKPMLSKSHHILQVRWLVKLHLMLHNPKQMLGKLLKMLIISNLMHSTQLRRPQIMHLNHWHQQRKLPNPKLFLTKLPKVLTKPISQPNNLPITLLILNSNQLKMQMKPKLSSRMHSILQQTQSILKTSQIVPLMELKLLKEMPLILPIMLIFTLTTPLILPIMQDNMKIKRKAQQKTQSLPCLRLLMPLIQL